MIGFTIISSREFSISAAAEEMPATPRLIVSHRIIHNTATSFPPYRCWNDSTIKLLSNGSHTAALGTSLLVCASVSLSYTLGVRGDKWRSGVRKAAFSPGHPITSQAVRESDRRSLSFSCSLSNDAWESGAWESWACTCALLFAEKSRGPDRGPVHVPLQWDQTNTPTVLLGHDWDPLKVRKTSSNSFSWPGGSGKSCFFTGNKKDSMMFSTCTTHREILTWILCQKAFQLLVRWAPSGTVKYSRHGAASRHAVRWIR